MRATIFARPKEEISFHEPDHEMGILQSKGFLENCLFYRYRLLRKAAIVVLFKILHSSFSYQWTDYVTQYSLALVRIQKLAKELLMVIPVSFFEEANNAHYNSVVVIVQTTQILDYIANPIYQMARVCMGHLSCEETISLVLYLNVM